MATPFITVAICTRNRAESLQRAISSVLAQLPNAAELLVVDNCSTDHTPHVLSSINYPNFRFITEDQQGISQGRNRALREARAPYVLFFDDDETAEPGWLQTYISFLSNPPPNLGAVGGPYIAEFETTPPSWINEGFGAYNLGPISKSLPGPATPAAGNCAYSISAIQKVGGFATDLPRSEDSELNLRLIKNGFQVWWLPEAKIRHHIPSSRLSLTSQMKMAFHEGRSTAIFRLKSAPNQIAFRVTRLLATPCQLAFQILTAFLCLLVGNKKRSFRLLVRTARSAGLFRQTLTF